MSTKNSRDITQSDGFFSGISSRVKLIIRLMGDRRVNPFVKILPIASLVYLVFPDIAIGPFDDAALLWLGSYLFVELCPPDVVQEHMNNIQHISPPQWQDTGETVDAEFRETRQNSDQI